MIRIYTENESDFSHDGLEVLDDITISCVAERSMNGSWFLNGEFLRDMDKSNIIQNRRILKVPTSKGEQLFRICKMKPNRTRIMVFAEHIFFDNRYNMVDELYITKKSGSTALNSILTSSQYDNLFVGTTNISTVASAKLIRKTIIEAIIGDQDNSFVNRWGGEIDLDNFNFAINSRIGADRGVEITYGHNLKGFEGEIDESCVVTRMMPIGFNGLVLPEKFIDSPLINNYSFPKIQKVEMKHIKVKENEEDEGFETKEQAYEAMRQYAQELYSTHNIDKPSVSLRLSLIPLEQTDQFKNESLFEQIYFGDTLKVNLEKYGFDVTVRVIKDKYDCLNTRYIDVDLGVVKLNVFQESVSIKDRVDEVVDQLGGHTWETILNEAQSKALELLQQGLENSYVVNRLNEILIMDSPNVESAKSVIRMNKNGIGFSRTGYAGPYVVGITIDGSINAECITTGALNAGIIKTGRLQSLNNKTWIDMNDGTFNFHDKISFDGTNLKIVLSSGNDLENELDNKPNKDDLGDLESSISITLSNEAQVIATNSLRQPFVSKTYSTQVTVYKGGTDITSQCTIGVPKTQYGIVVSKKEGTHNVLNFDVYSSIAIGTDTVNDGIFEIPIKIDQRDFVKHFSWALSKQGQDGNDGNDGKDGTSVTIKGSYTLEEWNNIVGDLTETAQSGDGYLVDGYLYVFDGKAFINCGLIKGDNGEDAKYITISGEQIFKYSDNFDGTPTPRTITLKAFIIGLQGKTPSWSYRTPGSTVDNVINSATQNSLTVGYNDGIWGTHKQLTFRCTVDGIYDEITIVKVTDGTNSYTVVLSNESHGISCGSNGVPNTGELGSGGKAVCDVIVYKGTTKLVGVANTQAPSVNQYNYSITSASNCTASRLDNDTLFINTVSGDSGSIQIAVNVESKQTINKVMTFNKIKQGTSAKYVVVNGEQAFRYSNNFTGTPTPNTITLTAVPNGTTSTQYYWSYRIPGSTEIQPITTSTSSTCQISHTATMWGTHKQLTFRCSIDGVYDEITVVKVSDGSNGTSGTNAKAIDLTASSQIFKSQDMGKTFTPSTISFTANVQNTTIFKWYYSVDGGSIFTEVISGANGITVSSNKLTLASTSSLFNAGSSIVIKVQSSDTNIYDTMTISRLIDIEDLNIGGRNLVINSGNFTTTDKWNAGTPLKWSASVIGGSNVSHMDFDGDGLITTSDYNLVSNKIGSTTQADLAKYDVNKDGIIDIFDVTQVSSNIGLSTKYGEMMIRKEGDYNSIHIDVPTSVNLVNGKQYVLTIVGKCNKANYDFTPSFKRVSDNSFNSKNGGIIFKNADVYETLTWKFNFDIATAKYWLSWSSTSRPTDLNILIKSIKLEEGNVSTDWTPSPEDNVSSYSVMLGNEAQVIPTDKDRKPLSTKTYSTSIMVYQGTTQRTDFSIGTITPTTTGFTVTKTASAVNFSVTTATALPSDDSTFDIPITIDGNTFNKKFSWSCGKQGNDGSDGSNGADGYTVVLTNETHSVSCSSANVPVSGELGSTGRAKSDIIVYRGATKLTAVAENVTPTTNQFKYSISTVTGGTASRTDNDTFYVNTLTQDTCSVPIVVNVEGKQSITKTMTLSKTKHGQAGTNAQYAIVTGDQIFKYSDNFTTEPTPASIRLTCTAYGVTGTPSYQWYYKAPTSSTYSIITGATNNYCDVSATNSTLWSTHKHIILKCIVNNSNSIWDEITMIKITDGTNGTDSYTALLTNEAHSVACNSSSTPSTGELGSTGRANSTVIVYKGNTKLTAVANTATPSTNQFNYNIGTVTGGTAGRSNNEKFYVATMTADTASVPITINVENKQSLTKTMTLTKVKSGSNGVGADIIPSSQLFRSGDGGLTYNPSSITLRQSIQGATYSSWQYSINGGSTWTTVVSGQNGLTISSNNLVISKTTPLFTKTVTTLAFKLVTSVSTIYDVCSISKLTDVTDLTLGTRNLIQNSTWNLGVNKHWNSSNDFSISDPESDKPTSTILKISQSGWTADKFFQKFSKETEINSDASRYFTLSFDVKITDKAQIDSSKALAAIRMFNTTGVTADTSAVYSTYVTLSTQNKDGQFLQDVIQNNVWYRVEHSFIPSEGKYIRVAPYLTRNGSVSYREFKLERSSKATDWTPAVEDIYEDIDNIEKEITDSYKYDLSQTEQRVTETLTANYSTKTELGQLNETLSAQITKTASDVTTSFTSTTSQIIGDVQAYKEEVKTMIRQDATGITIGKSDSPFVSKFSNTKLSFLQNNNEIAYISNQKLYINNAEIRQNLQFGKFSFIPRSNGNMSLKWIT